MDQSVTDICLLLRQDAPRRPDFASLTGQPKKKGLFRKRNLAAAGTLGALSLLHGGVRQAAGSALGGARRFAGNQVKKAGDFAEKKIKNTAEAYEQNAARDRDAKVQMSEDIKKKQGVFGIVGEKGKKTIEQENAYQARANQEYASKNANAQRATKAATTLGNIVRGVGDVVGGKKKEPAA